MKFKNVFKGVYWWKGMPERIKDMFLIQWVIFYYHINKLKNCSQRNLNSFQCFIAYDLNDLILSLFPMFWLKVSAKTTLYLLYKLLNSN